MNEDAEYARRKAAKASLWRRPCLEAIGAPVLRSTLEEMSDAVYDVRNMLENDYDTVLSIFGDDDELLTEFLLAFGEIENELDDLREHFDYDEYEDYELFTSEILGLPERDYDDAVVITFGRPRSILGYDDYEKDWFHLDPYQEDVAIKNAEKRIMRHTKQEILDICRKAGTKALLFIDLQARYDGLKSMIDIMRGDTAAMVQTLKKIDSMWQDAQKHGWRCEATFDALLATLPERMWLE